MLDSTPVTSQDVSRLTSQESILSRVLKFVQEGWPDEMEEVFYCRRTKLSCSASCLTLGSRVVIPQRGREAILSELYTGHPGISQMKALARCYCWWPLMDAEIEQLVKSRQSCQAVQKAVNQPTFHPWEWPGKPSVRLHINYAGPVEGKMLLVIVDSYSKYIEIHTSTLTTSSVTIDKLRHAFATHGLPYSIVSDGSAFTSDEFHKFCSVNGIKHTRVSPCHPPSNGLAERAVQTVNIGLKKQEEGSLESRLDRFLFQYRLTPQSTTGETPFQLLLNRQPRSRLDLVFPDLSH